MKLPASLEARLPTSRSGRIAVGIGAAFFLLFLIGLVPRIELARALRSQADVTREQLPIVSTATPRRAPEVLELPLPGSTQPLLETEIWARTNGYLQERYVDIGDRVKKGQLLALIDTPEIDQQLQQAIATMNQDQANVAKAEADLELARTTLARYLAAGPGTVSKQQIDERQSGVTDAARLVDAGRATVNADRANVRRLTELQSFQKVYAPFDGVITVRNVDPGSLISAGSTSGTTELFRLSQVDVLRIFVFVPQSYAPDIQVGENAQVTVRERPDRVFTGTVTRSAGAIDPTSRTLLTEVQVPNPDGALLAGSYATVKFSLTRSNPPLLVPSNALLIDAKGTRVALVEEDGTLRYRQVQLGRDYGSEVEVLAGLEGNDTVATGLSPNIAEGTRVGRQPPPQTPQTPPVGAGKK
ncbi:MAG TPA: efflux RND transporter periplasmic adaptor subunit [Myxococcota bacterium]|nr:efflux RND transporter periplasmic adaptor subunit [Myxococcota bacterium]